MIRTLPRCYILSSLLYAKCHGENYPTRGEIRLLWPRNQKQLHIDLNRLEERDLVLLRNKPIRHPSTTPMCRRELSSMCGDGG